MKKLTLAALAVSTMFATPAMAQWQGRTYGQDAYGIYQVNASVQSFCKFGTQNSGGAGNNGSADTNYLGGANEADGRFLLNIQDPNDNTVRAADAQYDIAYAVCNSPFTMQLMSQNGGLDAARTTSDRDFIETVPYRVNFRFDGNIAAARSDDIAGAWTDITTVTEARAGPAHVRVSVAARDKLLLEGAYSDILHARLTPNL